MNLFEVENNIARPSVHALMIQPYRRIWEDDTSTDKHDAIKLFTYVELLCSPRKSNPFYGLPIEERVKAVKREVYGDSNHPMSTDMLIATAAYEEQLEFSTESYGLVRSAKSAVIKLREFLDTVNLKNTTNSGGLVLKPKDITSALKEIPDVVTALENARNKINSDVEQDSKTRNNREPGLYENP